jgi:hypothetical protein
MLKIDLCIVILKLLNRGEFMKNNRLLIKLAISGLICSILLIGCGGGSNNNTTPDDNAGNSASQTPSNSNWNSMLWDTDEWG